MLDRELDFCCFVVWWPLAVAHLMGVRSQVQLNVIYAATGVREMELERETETRTETIKYFRINATRWLLLIKCQNRQHQLRVWRLKISIIAGWKSFTALPALFAWRSYLCIWVTFLTLANRITESHKYIRYQCVWQCVRVIVLLFQFKMCKLTWIFVLLSISRTNDRTAQGVRREGRGKRAKPVDGHVSRRISWLPKWVTQMICMIWRQRESERERETSCRRCWGEGVGVGFGFFWGFCTRWQLSNFSTSRQIKFCIFMSQSRRVKSEIIWGTFVWFVFVGVCVCVCVSHLP